MYKESKNKELQKNRRTVNTPYILIAGPSEVIGGITTVIKNHIEILRNMRIPFKVINTTAYHSGRGLRNLIILIKAIKKIITLVNPPGGIYIHVSSGRSFYRKLLLFLLLRAKFGSIPIILQIHHGLFPQWASSLYNYPLVYLLFRKTNCIIVPTPNLKKSLNEVFQKFNDKIYILPNKLPIAPPRQILKRNFNPPYNIFYLGYIKNVKCSQFLLEAIEKICEENLPFKFTLAGPGGDSKLVKKVGQIVERFPKKVQYINEWIVNNKKKELFLQAHLFIQVSPAESFSIVTYEAMSWGLPVIAVKRGGPAFLLKDEGVIWIEPYSSDAIYEALLKVLERKKSLKNMGEKNRKRALELYNFPISKKFIDILSLSFSKIMINKKI